jgi:hypothetical protein
MERSSIQTYDTAKDVVVEYLCTLYQAKPFQIG